MRILFMHHFPLEHSAGGPWLRRWARALAEAGHQCRLFVLGPGDASTQPGDGDVVEITCRADDPAADLPFDVPWFSTSASASGHPSFASLSDLQLDQYREVMRRKLDAQIEAFNPDIIHSQHIWVQGQLALETGVPYVLSAWGEELIDYAIDSRYRPLAEQAAENAGLILASDPAILEKVVRQFEGSAERAQLLPAPIMAADSLGREGSTLGANALIALYQAVLAARFGGPVG